MPSLLDVITIHTSVQKTVHNIDLEIRKRAGKEYRKDRDRSTIEPTQSYSNQRVWRHVAVL